MAWKSEKDPREQKKILEKVLPEYEPIWKAPREILDFPAAHGMWGADLDRFEDQMKAADSVKLYKCIDDSGDIFVIPNPWSTRRVRPNAGGRDIVTAPTRKLVMTAAEAKKAIQERAVSEVAETKERGVWD